MPLPTEQTCDITLEVCCDSLYEAANAILASAATALEDCIGDACSNVATFVSVGEPTYTGDGNYLAVWLMAMEPAPGPRGSSRPFAPVPRATFGFKLIETGYPTLESTGAAITPPDGERIDRIALHSYSHIERIIRTVYTSFRQHTLGSGCVCTNPQMGRLEPIQRGGGLAGWRWNLTLDLCW